MHLALFDFDGTISKKDTLLEFIKYYCGFWNFLFGFALHSPLLIAMKLGLVANWKTKEIILTHFFKGEDVTCFSQKAKKFSLEVLPEIIYQEALQKIQWHQEKGHRIYIISSSFEEWLQPWCQLHNLRLLSSRLEKRNSKISGKIEGLNCYGVEKINRLTLVEDITLFDEIYAYGDSSGDKGMFEICTKKYFKPFKK